MHATIRRLAWLLAVVCMVPACDQSNGPRPNRSVRVMAAASLAEAFKEIGAAFEAANPGVTIEFSFGGSNQLRTQLEHGAPGDVFASADRKQMDAAASAKLVAPANVIEFARNRLALVVPRANRAGIRGLSDLAKPGIKVVAADVAVPVGNATKTLLTRAAASPEIGRDMAAAIESNIVSREENVATVVTKVALDEVDAGFAYASDARGANADRIAVVALPNGLTPESEYVAAALARAADRDLAAKFVRFLRSEPAAQVLKGRGFPPTGADQP